MPNDLHAPCVASPIGGESPTRSPACDRKTVYWHRELPPLDAEPMGEHPVDANSMRVAGSLAHRGDLWDQCYRDLMSQLHLRLDQEVHRLGGHYAHVLEETITSRHDDRSGEVWLHGRLKYQLLRQPGSADDRRG